MTVAAARRVVYDCNVLLQALLNPDGPSGSCVAAVLDGRVELVLSAMVIEELVDVATRQSLRTKFTHLTAAHLEAFLEAIEAVSMFSADVPTTFTGCRDPEDNHYVDLAIATDASYLVSRDRDLLDLMNTGIPAGREYRARFPELQIVSPVAFAQQIESR